MINFTWLTYTHQIPKESSKDYGYRQIWEDEIRKYLLELNNKKIHIIHKSSNQNVTGIVVNEKVQVSAKYRKEIRQEIYYIRKFGLESHLKKRNIDIGKEKYINILYGKILYVLQINNKDNEFNEYKKFMNNFKNKF